MHIAFANGGNQTRSACAASECATHYSIASWQQLVKVCSSDSTLMLFLILIHSSVKLEIDEAVFFSGLFFSPENW